MPSLQAAAVTSIGWGGMTIIVCCMSVGHSVYSRWSRLKRSGSRNSVVELGASIQTTGAYPDTSRETSISRVCVLCLNIILATGLTADAVMSVVLHWWGRDNIADINFWGQVALAGGWLGMLVFLVAQWFFNMAHGGVQRALLLLSIAPYTLKSWILLHPAASPPTGATLLRASSPLCAVVALCMISVCTVGGRFKGTNFVFGGQSFSPRDRTNLFAAWTFLWIHGLLRLGFSRPLQFEDVPGVSRHGDPITTHSLFVDIWRRQSATSPSLLHVILRVHGADLLVQSIYCILADAGALGGPILLQRTLDAVMRPAGIHLGSEIGLSLGFFACALIRSLFIHNLWMGNMVVAQRLQYSLIDLCFDKATKLSPDAHLEHTPGRIMNIISSDIKSITVNLIPFTHWWIISQLLNLIFPMYFLWRLVGVSYLIGVSILLPVAFISGFVAKVMKKMRNDVMVASDKRVASVTQYLSAMNVVKMLGLERHAERTVEGLRRVELGVRLRYIVWATINTLLWDVVPVLVPLITFMHFTLGQGETLMLSTAFTTVAWLSNIQNAITGYPAIYQRCLAAHVSWKRIVHLLSQPEKAPIGALSNREQDCVIAEDLQLQWPSSTTEDETVIQVGTLRIPRGSFAVVIGPVGSGKSSFLAALSGGPINIASGRLSVQRPFEIAYAPQRPWLEGTTMRDNIVFGAAFDAERYAGVIRDCCLGPDLEMLESGDETIIGERGVSLSGGQRARVALARAVYCHSSQLTILDDPLSALDAHVAQFVFENCIRGRLKKRTVVMATSDPKYAGEADIVLAFQEGSLVACGPPNQPCSRQGPPPAAKLPHSPPTTPEKDSHHQQSLVKCTSLGWPKAEDSPSSVQSSSPVRESPGVEESDHVPLLTGNDTHVETKREGGVSIATYKLYLSAFGGAGLVIPVAILFLARICSSIGVTWWLAYWMDSGPSANVTYFLTWYSVLLLAVSVTTGLRSALFGFGGYRASKSMHFKLLTNVLRLPKLFFDTTPDGRVINRFSQDVATNDDVVPAVFSYFVGTCLDTIANLAVVSWAAPFFLIALVPIGIGFIFIAQLWENRAKNVGSRLAGTQVPSWGQRFEEVAEHRTISHVRMIYFSRVSQALDGKATIQAFGAAARFRRQCNNRVSFFLNMSYHEWTANQFAAMWMDFLGALVTLSAVFLCLLQVEEL